MSPTRALLLTTVLFPAATASAAELMPGCYHRDYSPQHLASHPDQVVDWISMLVEKGQDGSTSARIRVASANQGHARRSGFGNHIFDQWLFCYDDNGGIACSADCDGGRFILTRQTQTSITFSTRYLMVGEQDDCGGALDLAEVPGQPVKYRLDRVSDSACDGFVPLEIEEDLGPTSRQ